MNFIPDIFAPFICPIKSHCKNKTRYQNLKVKMLHCKSILAIFLISSVAAKAPIQSDGLVVIINGDDCDGADIVTVDKVCSPGKDEEGSVCANDGRADEAYCSYDVGPNACAYCFIEDYAVINGADCDKADVVIVDEHACIPEKPYNDQEGTVCANDGGINEAYCSYGIGPNACAYCKIEQARTYVSLN